MTMTPITEAGLDAANLAIWSQARSLVEAFGDNAQGEASQAVHDLAHTNDAEAERWLKVREATKLLLDRPQLMAVIAALEARTDAATA